MGTTGVGSTEATATFLVVPPRRSKPGFRYAGLLDLPDELLVGILEHFAAPMIKGRALRDSALLVSEEDEATMSRLCLLDKRIAKITMPLFWRHLCSDHYVAVYGQVLDSLRNSYSSSLLATKLSSFTSTLNLVTALSLDWTMESSPDSARDDLVNPEIIRLCEHLRYLSLDLRYTNLSDDKVGTDANSEDTQVYFSLLRVRKTLLELRWIEHLEINFEYISNDEDPDDYGDLSDFEIGRHLFLICQVQLDSLETLVISGLWLSTNDPDNEANLHYGASLNYRGLKMVRFTDDPAHGHVKRILGRLLEVASIKRLAFGDVSKKAMAEVPLAMRPNIVSLDLEGPEDLDAQLLLSFPSLRSLSCRVADVTHPGNLSLQKLENLTLMDNVQTVIEWIREYLSQPDYLPQLRHLRVCIAWREISVSDCKTYEVQVPESRDIAMQVELGPAPSWARQENKQLPLTVTVEGRVWKVVA